MQKSIMQISSARWQAAERVSYLFMLSGSSSFGDPGSNLQSPRKQRSPGAFPIKFQTNVKEM